MRPSVVYAVLSATHSPATLAQLVHALGDRTVLIHHDFSQQPDFPLPAPNARFVADPVRSGWASWGLVESVARTIEFAGGHYDYDYLQFLTPVDLPIRPIEAFEAWVGEGIHDVAVDVMPIDQDELTFMTFAYRAFARENSLAYRLLWRLRERGFFPAGYDTVNRAGLAVPVGCRRSATGEPTCLARLALALTRAHAALARSRGAEAVVGPLHVGSSWFGGTREACEHLVTQLRRANIRDRFEPLFCASEMLIATLFAASGFRLAPGNHAIAGFNGARPNWLGPGDLPRLRESGRFFARKFPDDPYAEVRRQVLELIEARPETRCESVPRIHSNETGR